MKNKNEIANIMSGVIKTLLKEKKKRILSEITFQEAVDSFQASKANLVDMQNKLKERFPNIKGDLTAAINRKINEVLRSGPELDPARKRIFVSLSYYYLSSYLVGLEKFQLSVLNDRIAKISGILENLYAIFDEAINTNSNSITDRDDKVGQMPVSNERAAQITGLNQTINNYVEFFGAFRRVPGFQEFVRSITIDIDGEEIPLAKLLKRIKRLAVLQDQENKDDILSAIYDFAESAAPEGMSLNIHHMGLSRECVAFWKQSYENHERERLAGGPKYNPINVPKVDVTDEDYKTHAEWEDTQAESGVEDTVQLEEPYDPYEGYKASDTISNKNIPTAKADISRQQQQQPTKQYSRVGKRHAAPIAAKTTQGVDNTYTLSEGKNVLRKRTIRIRKKHQRLS